MDVAGFASVIAAAAALFAVVATFLIYRASRSELVYLEYTGRYRDALEELPSDFFGPQFSLESVAEGTDLEQIQRSVHRYVDLCSEEVKLMIRSRVKPDVWHDWDEGIKSGLDAKAVKAIRDDSSWGRDYNVLEAYLRSGLRAARQEYHNQRKMRRFP